MREKSEATLAMQWVWDTFVSLKSSRVFEAPCNHWGKFNCSQPSISKCSKEAKCRTPTNRAINSWHSTARTSSYSETKFGNHSGNPTKLLHVSLSKSFRVSEARFSHWGKAVVCGKSKINKSTMLYSMIGSSYSLDNSSCLQNMMTKVRNVLQYFILLGKDLWLSHPITSKERRDFKCPILFSGKYTPVLYNK